jgi:hypothetical protein
MTWSPSLAAKVTQLRSTPKFHMAITGEEIHLDFSRCSGGFRDSTTEIFSPKSNCDVPRGGADQQG